MPLTTSNTTIYHSHQMHIPSADHSSFTQSGLMSILTAESHNASLGLYFDAEKTENILKCQHASSNLLLYVLIQYVPK